MRNAFLALAAVNLVYFAWAHWVDVPKAPPANEAIARLPRIKLVSELPGAQRPAQSAKTALNESATCFSVGPFGDIPAAASAASILEQKGFVPRQRAEAADTTEGFWVYVGGLKSDVEADRVRVSLERSGFRDALVMPSTAATGRSVSLGLFSDRAHAEQRVLAVKRLGFKAQIAEHKLPRTVYWIDLAPHPGMTTVPIAGLFGLESHIAVQPCPLAPAPAPAPATTTTAISPTYPIPAPQQTSTQPTPAPPAASPSVPLAPAKSNIPTAQAVATPKLP